MTNNKAHIINEQQLKKDRTHLKNLVETINALNGFQAVTPLTEAVRLIDKTEQLLMNYCHKLQAARAEIRYNIDQLERNK